MIHPRLYIHILWPQTTGGPKHAHFTYTHFHPHPWEKKKKNKTKPWGGFAELLQAKNK